MHPVIVIRQRMNLLSTRFCFLIFTFGFVLVQFGSLMYLLRFSLWSLLIKFILTKKKLSLLYYIKGNQISNLM